MLLSFLWTLANFARFVFPHSHLCHSLCSPYHSLPTTRDFGKFCWVHTLTPSLLTSLSAFFPQRTWRVLFSTLPSLQVLWRNQLAPTISLFTSNTSGKFRYSGMICIAGPSFHQLRRISTLAAERRKSWYSFGQSALRRTLSRLMGVHCISLVTESAPTLDWRPILSTSCWDPTGSISSSLSCSFSYGDLERQKFRFSEDPESVDIL